MPKSPDETAGGTSAGNGGEQPPPPELSSTDVPWQPGPGKGKQSDEAAEAIWTQLVAIRQTVDRLHEEAKEARLRRRLALVPVRVSDLMRGFQAAVSRANRSTRTGEGEGEDIERMAIKDLKVGLSAPILESAHAEDPVLMLPNLESADADSPAVSLEFRVVAVPRQARG